MSGKDESSSEGPQRRSNPCVDVLESEAFPEMASALRAQLEPIVKRWEQLVHQVLPGADKLTLAQLRDRIPDTLTRLAAALGAVASDQTQELTAQTGQHGVERFEQGYNIEELLIEYRLLRRVVVEQVEAVFGRRTTTAEDVALSMGIDTVLHQGVAAFVKHQQEQVRAANAAEAKYLTYLSHDLRGQLNGISLTMEVVKRGLKQEPRFTEQVADIQSLQDSLAATVQGMDKILQAERGRSDRSAEPQVAPIDIHALATRVAREFAPEAERKGLKLSIDVPAGSVVHSDRGLLQLILQNLVSNAVKYSSKGTVRIKAEGGCRLSVSDEGPGIPAQQVKGVFEGYRRGETHGQPGIGLGLAIAAQAATRLRAELTVNSTVGVGSTFCLSLPQCVGRHSRSMVKGIPE